MANTLATATYERFSVESGLRVRLCYARCLSLLVLRAGENSPGPASGSSTNALCCVRCGMFTSLAAAHGASPPRLPGHRAFR
jgi:hypothetical protein